MKVSSRTVVNGTTYRVTKRGADIEVASKAMVVVPSLRLRDEMRVAVKQATGCTLVDELMQGTFLTGRLAC